MADPVIEDIKSRLDLVDVIGSYITLRQSGTNFKGVCPFHNEKTPSFMVNRERQIFRCFGCGETGDLFAFIMKQENLDFPNALKFLADRAGVELPEQSPNKRKSEVSKTQLQAVNDFAAKFFHQVLTKHPAGKDAYAYIKSRGVSDASIERFLIGFAPGNNEPIKSVLTKQGFHEASLRLAGSPERYRNRVMFPFRDVIGHVVGFSGRSLGEQMPKYLNTSETELFRKNRYLYGLFEGKKAIAEAKRVMLVEGQLDLVLAHQSGTSYTVATSGTALTDDHLTILRRYSDTMYLAFDGDNAGKKATERAIHMALTYGFDVRVVAIDEGSDPGEIIAKNAKKWLELVEHPLPAIEWLFTYLFPNQSKQPSSTERQRIFDALFPYIDLLTDVVTRSYALQRLALLLGVRQEKTLTEAFEDWKAKREESPKKEHAKTVPTPEVTTVTDTAKEEVNEHVRRERSLIGLLLVQPTLLEYLNLRLEESDFSSESLARLYKSIFTWYNKTTNKSSANELIHSVEATLPPAGKQALQKLLFDTQTAIADFTTEQLQNEYTFLVQSVRQRLRDARIQSFADKIAQAESTNDRARVLELMREIQETLRS